MIQLDLPTGTAELNHAAFFDRLFGVGNYQVRVEDCFVQGSARVGGADAAVIGIWGKGTAERILAQVGLAVLDTVWACERGAKRPIIFVANTSRQALDLNDYLVLIARHVALARRRGHRTVALAYGEAVGGSLLAFGMLQDRASHPEAQMEVMDLHAMMGAAPTPSRLNKLEAPATDYDIATAPGAEGAWQMVALKAVWSEEDDWFALLSQAFKAGSEETW